MCISATSRQEELVAGIGYKCIQAHDTYFRMPIFFSEKYHYNVWHTRKDVPRFKGLYGYDPGFHLFTNFEDAEAYKHSIFDFNLIIVQVRYNTILAKGTQKIENDDPQCLDRYLPALVVREIYISK